MCLILAYMIHICHFNANLLLILDCFSNHLCGKLPSAVQLMSISELMLSMDDSEVHIFLLQMTQQPLMWNNSRGYSTILDNHEPLNQPLLNLKKETQQR